MIGNCMDYFMDNKNCSGSGKTRNISRNEKHSRSVVWVLLGGHKDNVPISFAVVMFIFSKKKHFCFHKCIKLLLLAFIVNNQWCKISDFTPQ